MEQQRRRQGKRINKKLEVQAMVLKKIKIKIQSVH
jgi:hypothetical protein